MMKGRFKLKNFLTLLASIGIFCASPAHADPRSGSYEGSLYLVVSGSKISGVFAERHDGTKEFPLTRACYFTISGTIKGNHAEISTRAPGAAKPISGTLDFKGSDALIRLRENQDGCAAVVADMTDEPLIISRDHEGKDWLDVALIGAKKVVLGDAPAPAKRAKPYLIQYDPVAIIARQGEWVKVRYHWAQPLIEGWVKAGDLYADAPPAAASVSVAPGNIAAEATGDIDGDGRPDQAQLLMTNDDGDIALQIRLSGDKFSAKKPTVYMPSFGWGDMDRRPDAKILSGDLLLEFANDIGRDRWSKKIGIRFRQGRLAVIGYHYSESSAFEPGKGFRCELNMLTGNGTRGGKRFTFPSGDVPLAGWTDAVGQKLCGN
ncbi:MAG: hypothetical protein LBV44_02295 [Methylobacillus sp.]|jgi:hypothetical protein|nr:hypothetical protein [Methylobacillus sp.]